MPRTERAGGAGNDPQNGVEYVDGEGGEEDEEAAAAAAEEEVVVVVAKVEDGNNEGASDGCATGEGIGTPDRTGAAGDGGGGGGGKKKAFPSFCRMGLPIPFVG